MTERQIATSSGSSVSASAILDNEKTVGTKSGKSRPVLSHASDLRVFC